MNEIPQPREPVRGAEIQRRLPDKTTLPKIIHFEDLAICGDEIWIENNGQLYRLRRTKQGKLILTK